MPGCVATPRPSAGLSFPAVYSEVTGPQASPWVCEKWAYGAPKNSPVGPIANELDGLKVALARLPP